MSLPRNEPYKDWTFLNDYRRAKAHWIQNILVQAGFTPEVIYGFYVNRSTKYYHFFACKSDPLVEYILTPDGKITYLRDFSAFMQEEPEMKNETTAELDVITMLQLEAGLRLYSCVYQKFDAASQRLQNYKETGYPETRYLFKSFEKCCANELWFVPNRTKNSMVIVRIVEEVGVESMRPGIEYTWLVAPAPLEAFSKGLKLDATMKRQIEMGRAVEQAKAAIGGAPEIARLLEATVRDIKAMREDSLIEDTASDKA